MIEIKNWSKKYNLDFVFKDKYTLSAVYLFWSSSIKHRYIIGNHHKNYLFISNKGEVVAYYSEIEKQLSKKYCVKFLDENFTRQHFNNSLKAREKVVRFVRHYRKIERELNSLSKVGVLNLFNQYQRVYSEVLAYFRSTRPEIVDPLVDLLDFELKKNKFNLEKLEKVRYYLTTPFFNDPIKEEQAGWLEIISRKFDYDLIMKHANKYPWLFLNTYTLAEAIKYLKFRFYNDRNNKRKIKEMLEVLKREEVHTEKFRKNIINQLDNHKKINILSKVIIKHASERLLTKCSWAGLDFIIRDLLKIIANYAGISVKEMMATYTVKEIENLVKRNKNITSAERQKRKDRYIFVSKNSKMLLCSGDEAKQLAKTIVETSENNEIKGSIASRGKITGRVIIIKSYEASQLKRNINIFKKGNILITGMTNPNIVPIIKKAAAIVTDQGGLTSHAAIISREFNIPCIVGTKIATKVLHDGDLVEVDADKGLVKILKKG